MFHVKQPPRGAFPSEPGCCRTRLKVGKLSGDGSPGETSTLAHPLRQRASHRLRPTAARVAYAAHQLSGRGRGKSIRTRCSRRLAGWAPHRLIGNCANRRILHCFGATEPIACPAPRVASECPAIRRILHSCLISVTRVRVSAIYIALSAHLQCVSKTRSHRSSPLPREHKQRRQSLEETSL